MNTAPVEAMDLQPIRAFIKEQLGLQDTGQPQGPWQQLLTERMAQVGVPSAAAYLARLRADEAEVDVLTSLLTINETYFYREAAHLRLLTGCLAPQLLARKTPGQAVRLLSVGCSTGEEPYSILIALREHYGEAAAQLFEVHAADIDRSVLERALAGVYTNFSFRALAPELIERYFHQVDGRRYRIDEAIRRQVRFHPLNLLAPRYPETLSGLDLIFFRNVSIYFDVPIRKLVLTRLKALLNLGGYLITGAAETLANDFGILSLRETDGVFFFVNRPHDAPSPQSGRLSHGPRLAEAPAAATRQPSHRQRPPEVPAQQGPRPHQSGGVAAVRPVATIASAEELFAAALDATRAERFDEALARLDALSAVSVPHPPDLVLRAHVLLEKGDLTAATAAAHQALALDSWCEEALLLLGRMARVQGDADAAIVHLRRLIYHRPNAWSAHFELAELYREQHRHDLARREYQVVLRQLRLGAAQQTAAASGVGVGVGAGAADRRSAARAVMAALLLPYPAQDLQRLCETRLARLETAD